MNNSADNSLEKLRALMEGLQIRNIDEFIYKAEVEDYRRFGKLVANKVKSIIIDHSPEGEYEMLKTLKRRGLIR